MSLWIETATSSDPFYSLDDWLSESGFILGLGVIPLINLIPFFVCGTEYLPKKYRWDKIYLKKYFKNEK